MTKTFSTKKTQSTKKTKTNIKDQKNKKDNNDWISALAHKSSLSTSVSSKSASSRPQTNKHKKNGGTVNGKQTQNPLQHEVVLNKQERIAKRNLKKRKRTERLMMSRAASSDDHSNNNSTSNDNDNNKNDYTRRKDRNDQTNRNDKTNKSTKYYNKELQQQLLHKLSTQINHILDTNYSNARAKYHPAFNQQQEYQPLKVIGKATKSSQLSMQSIQPLPNQYNGLGYARPSLLLLLRDVSFKPKFEEEFQEHITGFFGKVHTKAMKKQLDGNMLWRQLQKQKEQEREGTTSTSSSRNGQKSIFAGTDHVKWNGKKLKDMNPDEKVEAMIKLNLI
mmetsp:Transcript_13501/g.15187  ORF Transcript_13501/g.15187 Transcript_13501/m.15187 type:complete len:334 (-) Transcript_13501:85-1086(-)